MDSSDDTNNGSRSDAVRKATLSMLSGQHPAVRGAAIRAAVVHWFDGQMLAALAAASSPAAVRAIKATSSLPSDLLMAAIESLPFVEPHGEAQFRLHADVRQTLLRASLKEDQAFVDAISRAAADELLRRNEANGQLTPDELIELVYLLLVIDEERGEILVEGIFDGQLGPVTVAMLDRLMSYIDELGQEGRLSDQLVDRSKVWAVWAASAAGDYRRAAALGEGALADERLRANADLADALTYDVAFARWQLGEGEVAAQLAEPLAERRHGMRLGAMAKALIGDMATSPGESESAYLDALGSLLAEAEVPEGQSFSDPRSWHLAETEAADGNDAETLIGVEGGSGIYWIPADRLYAEIWLRLGAAEGSRARLATATVWLEQADELFQMLGDADGAQRTWDAQQVLAARHGDREGLHTVVKKYEAMLEWARATQANQLELQALLELASAHWNLDDLDAAQELYEKASVVAASLGELGQSAFAAQELARIAIAQGHFDKADLDLRTAMEGYKAAIPDEARRLDLLVGERWLADQRPDLARLAYERVLEWASVNDHAQDEVYARLGLASAAEAAFEIDEAERQVALAAALGPRIDPMVELDVLMQQARMLHLLSRDADAASIEKRIEARARELSVQRMLAWLLMGRAETASRRNKHLEAVESYRSALRHFEELRDEEGLFHSLRGLAHELPEAGDPNGALEAAERTKEIATRSGRRAWESLALFESGTALVGAGRYDAAIAELLKAHHQTETDNLICANLGWAYLRAGQFENSLEWSYRALTLNPRDAFPYRNVGHALLGLGRLEDAKKAYKKAIEERFGDENFRNTLAELELLRHNHPGLRGLDEIVAWFQDEQAKIDATGANT